MIVDAASGWVEGARRIPSPNFDVRPAGVAVDLIVIHGISLPPGAFGGGWVDRFFCNELPVAADPYFATICDLRVSAHVLIDRAGDLTQYVSFNDRAWHAGESSHCGREACNDFSIGIELEGADDVPYTSEQYATLGGLIAALRRAYPLLSRADVVGHSDIAPGRKTDPGPGFDWARLRRTLAAESFSSS